MVHRRLGPDDVRHGLGAREVDLVEPLADLRLVGEVRLEDEAEGSALLGDEVEVRVDHRVDPRLVVLEGQRVANKLLQLGRVLVDERE